MVCQAVYTHVCIHTHIYTHICILPPFDIHAPREKVLVKGRNAVNVQGVHAESDCTMLSCHTYTRTCAEVSGVSGLYQSEFERIGAHYPRFTTNDSWPPLVDGCYAAFLLNFVGTWCGNLLGDSRFGTLRPRSIFFGAFVLGISGPSCPILSMKG